MLPPWPSRPPRSGAVVLREFTEDDLSMVLDLATDPYVPLIGTLPARATPEQARDWIDRNRRRWAEGAGFSFAIAQLTTGRAVGAAGLWLRELAAGRASAGYSVAPGARGHGYAADALTAVTDFAWSLPGLHRVELHIEPWNTASVRTAARAGYQPEGLLRSYLEIGGRRRDMLLHAAVRPA
jgi:RimJ/RimL family protein N-acetyltransferase